jgi:hypothetical protein
VDGSGTDALTIARGEEVRACTVEPGKKPARRRRRLAREEGRRTRYAAPCAHPGCERPATEIAVVESAWEDTATGSALMVCSDHAERYLARMQKERREDQGAGGQPSPHDPMLRARRRGSDR